jgi:uncharacterized membrane protein
VAAPAGAPAERLSFLDGLRGIAIILMVVNHTSRWWMDRSMGWPRYYLVYGSVILPAAIFLFLVGFCLPISYHRRLWSRGPDGAPADTGGWRALLLTYGRRGAGVIGAGLLLNLLVFRDEPVWTGGVLQTIGFSIIVAAMLMPLLASGAGRLGLLAVGVGLYVVFALSYGTLTQWVKAHPTVARVIFFDFPPWPWVCPALIGLVLGWTWLEARRRGAAQERRFFALTAAAGAVCLAAYAAWEWLLPTSPRFGFPRDFVLNHHWTPRGITTALVAGGVALLLAGTYWLMGVRGVRLPWLVVLGQTALMLYFLHQIIVYTIVNQWLGRQFNDWWSYAAANAALMVLLVYMGKAWLGIKAARRGRSAAKPATS